MKVDSLIMKMNAFAETAQTGQFPVVEPNPVSLICLRHRHITILCP